jgi:penicillin G amidase
LIIPPPEPPPAGRSPNPQYRAPATDANTSQSPSETLSTPSSRTSVDFENALDKVRLNPPSTETIVVEGLNAPAKIAIDYWGIPHLEASGRADLFFVQGFNAARDRLWQIDLWRKRGLGRLAGEFGPGYLAQDYAARLFLYRGDMTAEWASYAPDARAICEAFVAGINAYVDLTEREPERLPPEFRLFGTRPACWTAEDVVRVRSHALVRNAQSEVQRANVIGRADLATDLLRCSLDPLVEPQFADGVTPQDVPMEALALFDLATAPVSFEPTRLATRLDEALAGIEAVKATTAGRVTVQEDLNRGSDPGSNEGSNNWVVHGSRTATGRPILANDPHRSHAVPSLRYLVHLTMPGFNAIGAGEPSVPGLSLGHNEDVAFGLTIFRADQEDVYVYETHPDDPNRYRYEDGWEPFQQINEVFAVKGEADQILTLSFSRHGPILFRDNARHRAVGMRSVWFEPGAAAYLGSLSAMRARTAQEYAELLGDWKTPSVNHVCADVKGTIGWLAAGLVPVRRNWEGLLPVPGDGRFEWDGFLKPDQLPREINPSKGFFATANEMNLPQGWPHEERRIGHEWTEPSRATRIHEVLRGDGAHTVSAATRLQTDVRSLPAMRICRLLDSAAAASRETTSEDAAIGLALLRDWNHDLDAASPAAGLFEVWWMLHLRPALLARLAPDDGLVPLLAPGDISTLLALLEEPDERFGARSVNDRDALLLATLADAVHDCVARLGPNPAEWAWGRLHHGYFQHAASPLLDKPGTSWDVGPLPLGGSGSTPMHTGYRNSDFRANYGASVRLVMDVGDWDNSVCINAPGQSGDPGSPHYDDLAPPWADGAYVPLLYSQERVEEATEKRIWLVPPDA